MKAKASDNIQDLLGVGLEFLIDRLGNVRLEFFNGNIVRSKALGDNETTVIPEAVKAIPETLAVRESVCECPMFDDMPCPHCLDQGPNNVIFVNFIYKRRIY